MLEQRIGLIGAGQMATALAHGFLKAGLTSADRVIVVGSGRTGPAAIHADDRRADDLADSALVVAESDVLILAVKPQQLAQVSAVTAVVELKRSAQRQVG